MITVHRVDGGAEIVLHSHGAERLLPALWLRERSPDPGQLDAGTQQRLVDPHRFPVDLAVLDASVTDHSLWVRFSDGHAVTYPFEVLARTVDLPDGLPEPLGWRSGEGHPRRHDWIAVRTEDKAFRDALADFLTFGTIVVTGTPREEGVVVEVGNHFGIVRDTNFGRLFDVRSVPNPNDLAYTPVPLGPHTDNPYRDPTPGIQLLHCIVNDTTGGLSTLVDSVAVCEQLRQEDPAGYDLLCTVNVQFRFVDATDDLRMTRTVIGRDVHGRVTGLAYSPRLEYLPIMSTADTQAYQRARQRMSEMLSDPAYEERFVLQPGEVEIFDNQRVLHGRTGFDPQEGLRHLQGCYIDGDAPRSRYRVLQQRVGA